VTQIEIFEPAMCCATGVCGPEPDATLVSFGETVRRVESDLAGSVTLTRTLLNQHPMRFAQVPVVFDILKRKGVKALPIVVVNGSIAVEGVYPSFQQIAEWSQSEGSTAREGNQP
jgi:hypothetical protein